MSTDDQAGPERPDDPDVGDLGEEAARLLAALAGWTRTLDEHVATGAPECQWCPVCRVVHAVRTTSPEVREHLGAAAGSLLQAISGLLPPPAATDASPDAGGTRDPDGAPGDDGLTHIDLDEPEEER